MNTFEHNIKSIWGKKGSSWLNSLPRLSADCAKQWGLSELIPIKNLSHNYILSGYQGSVPIILKIGLDIKQTDREANALKFYNGKGCVKLLNHDSAQGALLIERVIPGESLKSLFPADDKKATHYAVNVIKQLHAVPHFSGKNFPHIKEWLTVFNKDFTLPYNYLLKARILSDKLINTLNSDILLHGDLHHDNILLDNEEKCLAIDPKGIVGEREYECGAFIRNPLPEILHHRYAKEIIKERIEIFTVNLGFCKQRLIDWSFVQAMLAACWIIEDNLDPNQMFEIADIISAL